MANWKKLHNMEDVVGQNILLREKYNLAQNVIHYAGIVDKRGEEQYVILTLCGMVALYPDDYAYHFILIDEIKF